jgi:hypothetical protein
MRETTILLTLVAALALPAPPARAEPAGTDLDGLVARAATDGLPTEPLRSKIQEGRAKKVPERRIQAVVQQLVRHMHRARHWLRKGKKPVSPQLLAAVGQARLAGVPEQALRTLAPPGSGPRAALQVDTLADLHTRGYREAAAMELVRRVRRTDLPALGASLDGLRRRAELTHAEAADALLKAVRNRNQSLHRAMQSVSPRGRPTTPVRVPQPRNKAGGPR